MKGKLLMLSNMKTRGFIYFLIGIILIATTSCNNTVEETDKVLIEPKILDTTEKEEIQTVDINEIEETVLNMSLEEKVGQMFIVAPEVFSLGSNITKFEDLNLHDIEKYNIGGFIMFNQNIINPEQIRTLNEKLLEFDDSLFISVDEEGGQVARISGKKDFPEPAIENSSEAYKGDFNKGFEIGDTIGTYLEKYNFNLNFAPSVDVLLNEKNTVVNKRSFSNDATIVSSMAENVLLGFREHDIFAAAKHFPGHGNTAEDTHYGFANSYATLEEMKKTELIPFQKMIDRNIEMIMVSHVIYPNLSDEDLPATLNKDIINGLLLEEMGYKGIVITDAMNMGAIANGTFTVEESTVKAILAGNDIILMPTDFRKAYNAVLTAVEDGTISEDRINESVIKILSLKRRLQN